MTILFLYTELAGYFLAGIRELAKKDVEIHIVRWPINKEAPFEFKFPENVNIYERNDYSNNKLIELAEKINPTTIIASGWIDKGYLKVCRHFKKRAVTVMTMDNQWHGNFRQYIFSAIAPFKLPKLFNKIWIPGTPQEKYALKLGFRNENIQTGLYSADVSLFSQYNEVKTTEKKSHSLLYIGRYIHAKGLDLLFKVWLEICEEHNHNWKLVCVGTGELFDSRPIHPTIIHKGFLQPDDIIALTKKTDAFVLSSRFEPWGVVVHEMAAAKLPMIVSSSVGSVTEFLEDGVNGYIFENENANDLKVKLLKMMTLSNEELALMSKKSYKKAISHTPEKWAKKVMNF